MRQRRTGWSVLRSSQRLWWGSVTAALLHAKACVDTTEELDSGGDNCSYYDDRPEFCGCCDTPSFSAADCCSCQQSPPGGTAAWWTAVFHAWPRKAVKLVLEGKGLYGELPGDFADRWPNLREINLGRNRQLGGALPPSLGQLVNLRRLILKYNQHTGSVPPELARLSNLEELSLDTNQLNGNIPRELGNLSNLKFLDLSRNSLSGGIPAELGRLSKLRALSLEASGLSGSIPAELGHLTDLQGLVLSANGLSGAIPAELGGLSNLTFMLLHGNLLDGSIPWELGNLSKLRKLWLYKNQLRGSIPAEIGNLSDLTDLNLEENQLSGIPAELGKLSNLEELRLRQNQFSHLPADLGNLSNLRHLDVSLNQLGGTILPELGRLSQLQDLSLQDNKLSGNIPAAFGRLSRLRALRLDGNQLSGSILAEVDLDGLSSLGTLQLSENQFSGIIPAELTKLSNLGWLDLRQNRLSGSIPAALGNLSRLQRLFLSNNQLNGTIPVELGRIPRLMTLELTSNQLSGNVPAELGTLPFLFELRLNSNQLTGGIPAELGRLSYMHYLNLQDNQLGGSIPTELEGLSYVHELSLQGNQLTGSIPPGLGNLRRLQKLHLDGNQLSGSIPAELGNLSNLRDLNLDQNKLNGSIPAELGRLSQLQTLHLAGNHLGGGLPPALGQLSQLKVLSVAANQLAGGIPSSYARMSELQTLNLERNPGLCGSTDAISELRKLEHLQLRGCCFQSISLLPPGLKHLDLGENNLTLPPLDRLVQFGNRPPRLTSAHLPNLTTLLLDHNSIRLWPTSSVVPLKWFARDGSPICGWEPQDDGWRIETPKLEMLDVSANQLSTPIYDFLASLSHLSLLVVLRAADNRLFGALPRIGGGGLVHNYIRTDDIDLCLESSPPVAFKALRTLDLSGNHITAVLSAPPPRLVQVELSANQLTGGGLDDRWWRGNNSLELVNVEDNPELRLPISFHPDGFCPDRGAGGNLVANSQGWTTESAGSECTSLCRRRPQVRFNNSVKEEVLCRCSAGQGTGLNNCTACPDDFFSVQFFDQEAEHYARKCSQCPAHSELRGFNGQCFADCSCAAGYFMQKLANGTAGDLGSTRCSLLRAEAQEVDVRGKCTPCGIWKTSKPGARTSDECLCNSNSSTGGWQGLLQQGTQCRCPEGQRINFAQRRCVLCEVAEVCTDWSQSLQPPGVKPGFWALPHPPEGEDGTFGNFSHYSIWRCDSPEACLGNSSCGWHRAGTACSLCERGFFRTPAGSCSSCPQGYADTRLTLLAVLIASMVFPLLAHALLSADSSTLGLVMTLRSFRVSLKQLLKFAQILGVVSLFQVQWPQVVVSIFQLLSFDFASWAGAACLDSEQQQTVALELIFRWMLPVLGAVVTVVAAVAATSCGHLCPQCRGRRLGRILSFRAWDILRVLLFFLQLFYPSLLKNALLPLTCSPSPNGYFTMNIFPHQVCWDAEVDASFWPLALAGSLITVSLIIGYPALLFHLRRKRLEEGEAGSGCAAASAAAKWWAFALEDFRLDRTDYALVVVGKDVLLNLTIVVLPGLGTAQLLLTAMVSFAYAVLIFNAKPYHDTSNTLLEASTSAAVATLCMFSAGMGFQSEPGVLDISNYLNEGRKNPSYLQRAFTLVALQALSLFAPAAIITYQVLTAFKRTRRCIPRALLPSTHEERETWREEINSASSFVYQLDDVALQSLYRVVMSSRAARGTLQRASTKSSVQPDGAWRASLSEQQGIPAAKPRAEEAAEQQSQPAAKPPAEVEAQQESQPMAKPQAETPAEEVIKKCKTVSL